MKDIEGGKRGFDRCPKSTAFGRILKLGELDKEVGEERRIWQEIDESMPQSRVDSVVLTPGMKVRG